MTDKAWKICKSKSDSSIGVCKIHGQHPVYRKSFWIYHCKKGSTIMGYWDWVAEQDTESNLNLEKPNE